MPNPVIHWEILSKDPKKARDFFSQLFDWYVDVMEEFNYGIVDAHAEGGINGGIGGHQDEAYKVTFYVQVDDLQEALDKAEKLGGKTVTPPTEIPGMVTLAHFSDLDGNVIGLIKS